MKTYLPSELTEMQVASWISHNEDWHRAHGVELTNEDTGPGKFEGNENQGLAEVLYQCTLNGWCDDQVGSVDENGYWSGLLGRFIVTEDSQGFFSYESFDSETKAEAAFRKIDPYGDVD